MSDKSLFLKHVEWALKNYRNPIALGTESPLATPFLLGEALPHPDASHSERGVTLQKVIAASIDLLDGDAIHSSKSSNSKSGSGDKQQREREVLRAYYIEGISEPAALERFSLTKTPFHRVRRQAIQRLSSVLMQELRPAIRLERPGQTTTPLYGRGPEEALCRSATKENALLWVTGPSGIGKSALVKKCVESWPSEQLFWLTLQPDLNDNIDHFVFELGYFLSKCGYPTLWQEWLANANIVHKPALLNIIRHAFEGLTENNTPILLCIDNADLLQRTQNPGHEQLVRLLLSLRSLAPLFLIGQRAITDADDFCMLTGISSPQLSQWLDAQGVTLTQQQLMQLYAYVQGNPRLVELTILLTRRGLSIQEVLYHLRETPGIKFLIERVVQRLTAAEQSALIELSIFRSGAPADLWSTTEASAALVELQALGLAGPSSPGRVHAYEIYSTVIVNTLSTERLQALHSWAAMVFEERAAYTDAITHWVQANEPTAAIALWARYATQEINQGQAHRAFRIFDQVETSGLSATSKAELALLLADLERLLGHTKKALSRLESIVNGTPLQALSASIKRGELENDMGMFTDAKRNFQEALQDGQTLAHLQLAKAHKGLAWTHMRERSLEDAQEEALRAKYEVENILGAVAEEQRAYERAAQHYHTAFQLAESLGYEDGVARTSGDLAVLYTWLGTFDEARRFQERSERSYQRIGKQISLVGAQINRALLENAMGEHEKAANTLRAVETASRELPDGLPDWHQALIAQGLAEAYLGQQDLGLAEAMAQKAIRIEEDGVLADAYRTYGEIMHQRGQFDTAEEFIKNSVSLLTQHDEPDPYLLGYAWRALARLYSDQSQLGQAANAKQMAIDLFESIHLQYEAEQTRALTLE